MFIEYIDLMVVKRMKCCCCWRRHPCTICTSFKMRIFLFKHLASYQALPTFLFQSEQHQKIRISGQYQHYYFHKLIQTEVFISPFFIIGPASIDVCISSPVRSKNPVFIKTLFSNVQYIPLN